MEQPLQHRVSFYTESGPSRAQHCWQPRGRFGPQPAIRASRFTLKLGIRQIIGRFQFYLVVQSMPEAARSSHMIVDERENSNHSVNIAVDSTIHNTTLVQRSSTYKNDNTQYPRFLVLRTVRSRFVPINNYLGLESASPPQWRIGHTLDLAARPN